MDPSNEAGLISKKKKKVTPKKERMYAKSELKKIRGWTDRLISKFMPEPDEKRANPKYRTQAPMCLYRASRVERIEKRITFLAAKEKADLRKIAAQKAVATKTAD